MTREMAKMSSLCDNCATVGCIFQAGIEREKCAFYKNKNDVIKRQDAIDAVTEAIWHYPNEYYKNLNVYEVAEALVSDAIKLLPSRITEYKTFCGVPIEEAARIVQEHNAEPKTGEWVMLERVENVHDIYGVPTWGVNYMCDKCGFITTAIQDHFSQYKFCPYCGADMRGYEHE